MHMPINQHALQTSSILIVDDQEVNQIFLRNALQSREFSNVQFAFNGKEALDSMRRQKPDLIILDLLMPVMDGFECCRAIRADAEFSDIPILIQTALTEHYKGIAAFDVGASDFISKPILADELCARVKVHLERQLLLNDLRRYHARIAEELDGARILQESTLPKREQLDMIKQQYGIEVASHAETSSEIGGDLWGTNPLFPKQLSLWMGDFSGHGVTAALNAFRLHAYMEQHSPLASKPGEYLTEINEKLLHHALKGQFATMFYGIMDTGGNQLHYAAAGCPSPILLHADGTTHLLECVGLPLGIHLNQYLTRVTSFSPGDTLIVYSDALIETPDREGIFITEDSIIKKLQPFSKSSADEILQTLLAYLRSHAAGQFRDDLTLAVYSWIG